MVMVGTIAWLILYGLHGEPPGTGQQVIEQARGALWRPIHLFTIVAIVIVASGLALLTGTLMEARASAVGHAGAMIAVPAAAVLGVRFAIDGFVLAALADAYAMVADEATRAMHLMQADLLLDVIGGVVWAIAGVLIFLRAPDAPYWLVFIPVLPVAVWLLGFGWLAWQRSGAPLTSATPEMA